MIIINVILLSVIFGALILWKLGKIYVKFNFLKKNTVTPKNFEIDELLIEIDKEITVAAQLFFAWKSIHNVASKDAKITKAINNNALLWNIYLHSLQTTFFISIGRIFDVNLQLCSIHLLFRQCENNIMKFNKSSFEQRKINEAGGKRPDYLDTFLLTVYEPKQADFKNLKKNV